jgi:hypothetical protein
MQSISLPGYAPCTRPGHTQICRRVLGASELNAQSTAQHKLLASQESGITQHMQRTGMRKGRAEAQWVESLFAERASTRGGHDACISERHIASGGVEQATPCHRVVRSSARELCLVGRAASAERLAKAQEPITRCHAAVEAGKARRPEQAAHRPTSWLAPHSMAQAVACSSGGRSAGGEEAAAQAQAKDGNTRLAPCVAGGQRSGGAAGLSRGGSAPEEHTEKKWWPRRQVTCAHEHCSPL